MGLLKRIEDLIFETAQLLMGFNARTTAALTKINANPPTYSADDLTRDLTQSGLDTLKLWLKFWKPLSDPTLPTLVITGAQTSGGGTASGEVSLGDPVPLGVNPGATPLVFVGDPASPAPPNPSAVMVQSLPPVTGSPSFLDPLRQRLTLQVTLAPGQQRGIYHGLILLNAALPASPPIATVIARVV